MRRAGAIALVAALLGVALGFAPATPSSASTYYDYWGYWHKPPGAPAWQYSTVGASGYYLKEGTQVEGWRYAIGTASQNDPKPRPVDVTYDDYCAGKNTSSTYRVLLIVDYGTQSGAPKGPVYSCFGFDKDHQPNGLQVLTNEGLHTERDSGGLICAIDTYPKTGCGDVVSSPAPAAPRPAPRATTSSRPQPSGAATSSAPAASTAPARSTAAARKSGTAAAVASTSATAAPLPGDSATPVVATQFVPPRRRGHGVTIGFLAACGFVVVLIGAVLWQRRRRA